MDTALIQVEENIAERNPKDKILLQHQLGVDHRSS
jgi:hypothetical protein